jgi:hypothetical protein
MESHAQTEVLYELFSSLVISPNHLIQRALYQPVPVRRTVSPNSLLKTFNSRG